MNIAAFFLAVLAIICFSISWRGRSLWGAGFALLTAAWIMQLVWQTPHVVSVH